MILQSLICWIRPESLYDSISINLACAQKVFASHHEPSQASYVARRNLIKIDYDIARWSIHFPVGLRLIVFTSTDLTSRSSE